MKGKRLGALLLALILCAVLAAPAFAAGVPESYGAGEGTASSRAAGVLQNPIFWAGVTVTVFGVVGLVMLFVVSRASASARNRVDEREEVFDEIEEAEQRVKQRQSAAQAGRRELSRRVDPKADTGEIARVPARQAAQTRPPVSRQPERTAAQRPARPRSAIDVPMPPRQRSAPPDRSGAAEMEDVYSSSRPRHAAPEGTAPKKRAAPPQPEQAEQPEQPRPAPAKPSAPAAPEKYDVDDILREVRENRV